MACGLGCVFWLWSSLAWERSMIYCREEFPGRRIPFVEGTWLWEEEGPWRWGREQFQCKISGSLNVMWSLMGFNRNTYL